MAELIRRQVDELIKAYKTRDRDELREQAKEARGKYGSGRDDVSEAHDSYLGGDFFSTTFCRYLFSPCCFAEL